MKCTVSVWQRRQARDLSVVFEDGKLVPLQCPGYPVLSAWPLTRAARTQESPEVHDLQCDITKQALLETTWLSQLHQQRHASLKIAPESHNTVISKYPQPRPHAHHGGARATFGRFNYTVKSFQGREFGQCAPVGFLVFG